MGLYPIAGWITGVTVNANYPWWYTAFAIALFAVWIAYEDVVDYLEYREMNAMVEANVTGAIGAFAVYGLTSAGFPITMGLTLNSALLLLILALYLALGIAVNIGDKLF